MQKLPIGLADLVACVFLFQVNGGSIAAKVDYAFSQFEKPVTVDAVFQANEMIDTIAITKGRGTLGVIARWGVTRLPRKTHRGLRKVCAGLESDSAVTGMFILCVSPGRAS